jgi:hypothetical protein
LVTHDARRITHRWDIATTVFARGSLSSANLRADPQARL